MTLFCISYFNVLLSSPCYIFHKTFFLLLTSFLTFLFTSLSLDVISIRTANAEDLELYSGDKVVYYQNQSADILRINPASLDSLTGQIKFARTCIGPIFHSDDVYEDIVFRVDSVPKQYTEICVFNCVHYSMDTLAYCNVLVDYGYAIWNCRFMKRISGTFHAPSCKSLPNMDAVDASENASTDWAKMHPIVTQVVDKISALLNAIMEAADSHFVVQTCDTALQTHKSFQMTRLWLWL